MNEILKRLDNCTNIASNNPLKCLIDLENLRIEVLDNKYLIMRYNIIAKRINFILDSIEKMRYSKKELTWKGLKSSRATLIEIEKSADDVILEKLINGKN